MVRLIEIEVLDFTLFISMSLSAVSLFLDLLYSLKFGPRP